jgi:hypothetical protein
MLNNILSNIFWEREFIIIGDRYQVTLQVTEIKRDMNVSSFYKM